MIRVVIAEDQALVLGALAALLGLEGGVDIVAQASDGLSALEAVRRLQPDVLVSDIEMPGMTGLEVAEVIASERLSTAVIIVTTFARPGYLRRAMNASVRGYLLKDAPAAQLAAAIQKVFSGGKAVAAELADAAWDGPSDPLTRGERAVLRLADEGHTNKEIAKTLNLSPGTVRNYLSEAVSKLDCTSRHQAGKLARENGWL